MESLNYLGGVNTFREQKGDKSVSSESSFLQSREPTFNIAPLDASSPGLELNKDGSE